MTVKMWPQYLLLLAVVTIAAGKEACTNGQADVVFLLDSSGSVGYDNFQTELSFVSTFVKGLPIGPDAVQFSLVLYSSRVNEQFQLNTYHSEKDLVKAIQRVKYVPGGTKTDKALEYVRNKSYQPSSGGRPGVPQILIVVTDGISSNPVSTARQASLLHQDGVLVISVGVGRKIKMKELRGMASNNSLVYNVMNFDGLNEILSDLQSTTCKQMTKEATACTNGQADVVFLLDSSGSVGFDNFQTELSFVSTFVKGLPTGPDAVQFSLVLYSSRVNEQFQLNTYQSERGIIEAIQRARYTKGETRTDEALEYVRNKSYQPESGGRRGVPKILIVVTDGISLNPVSTAREASLLHQDGVLVISVGVGQKIKMKELQAMASNNSLVYNVMNFDGLNEIMGDLQSTTCKQMTYIDACANAPAPTPFRRTALSPNCQWPSVVRVMLGSGYNPSLMCGGVLVGRHKVITTASCVDRYGVHSVVFGEDNPAYHSVTIQVSSTTIHPDFYDKGNDIAVLRLAEGVEYNDCIFPACLSPPRAECDALTHGTCHFTGWTITGGRGVQRRPQLRFGSARYLSARLCSLLFKYGMGYTTPASTTCIKPEDQSVSPTSDDEGGMVSCLVNGTWILQSLVNVPSNDNYPSLGVDLRNPSIINFIEDN